MQLTSVCRRSIGKHFVLTAFLVFSLALSLSVESAAETTGVTTVREIREQSPDHAFTEQVVRLRGVVTAISGWKSSFFLQDSSSGISVDRLDSGPAVQSGQLVEIVGVTSPGMFAPLVKAKSVSILGTGTLPIAKVVEASDLAGGTLDSRWIKVKGLVRSAVVVPIWGHDVLVLELDIGDGNLITARVRSFTGVNWHRLPAAIVSLEGVCGSVFNDRRQYVGSRIFVPSLNDVKVLRSGPADLFDRPLQSLSSIARFSFGKNAFSPIRVRGTVTYWQGEDHIYVQDGSEGTLVRTNQQSSLGPGSIVDVVGFAREGDYSPSLESATLRLVGSNSMSTIPVNIAAAKVIEEKDGFPSSPYDSLLIRLSGVLKQVVPGVEEQVLILQDDKTTFTARLVDSTAVDDLPPLGSRVQVTGVCVTRVDTAHEPSGFKVLLRSAADVVVLKHAPWWNAEHAKTVVAAMAAALIAMGVLLTVFRREATLKQLSLSDSLTDVHNRRGFVLLAEQQWRIACRNKTAMLLFYVDVNRFKQINDTFGHKEGDVALQTVASNLKKCFRTSDIIGRLGGDEFAVVACDAMTESRERLQERLGLLMKQSSRESAAKYDLSLSAGALLCDQTMYSLTIEDLLARADALMYSQKVNRTDKSHNVLALEI